MGRSAYADSDNDLLHVTPPSRGGHRSRIGHREHEPTAGLSAAIDTQCPAVLFSYPPGDGQAQPGARPSGIQPHEAIEDMLLGCHRDARTRVESARESERADYVTQATSAC